MVPCSRPRTRSSALVCLLAVVALRATAQAGAGGADSLFVSLLSGTYRTDQILVMEALEPDTAVRYAVARPDGGWHTEITYREPLRLTALPGEEREYRIRITLTRGSEQLDSRDLAVKIDRLAPLAPQSDPPGGSYPGALGVSFRPTSGGIVYYALNTDILGAAVRWDGRPIAVDPTTGDQVLQSYTMDDAGNRSAIATELYTRQAAVRELAARVDIVSPAEGTFANLQMLYLVTEDVGTVRYTLDGTDPSRSGSLYTEPRLLEYTGRLVLRVAAYPVGSDRNPILLERAFEVVPETEQTLVVSTASGVYTESRDVVLLGERGEIMYALADESPRTNGVAYKGPITLASTPGTRRITVLRVRFRSPQGVWGQEYRYTYVMDRRVPPAPEVVVVGSQPSGGPLVVRVTKEPSATVRYTIDGSEPGELSALYTDPVRIAPTAGGVVVFKAVAYGARGTASAVVSRTLRFDRTPPATPQVDVTEATGSRVVRIALRHEAGSVLVHEIAPTEASLRAPTVSSPVSDDVVVVDAPMGARRELYLRFAAVDAAGNISVPTPVLHVLVDKEPPALPVFLTGLAGAQFDTPQRIVIPAGTPELHYEMRSDGSVAREPTLGSATLAAGDVLELEGVAGELVQYGYKLLLRDELGNTSDVYGPYVATVDRRKPSMPRITAPADGSRVSSTSVLVTPEVVDSGVRVAYVYTTDGTVPEPPTAASPRIDGALELRGVEGQELDCTVVLLPVSSSGNLIGDPRTLRFVIDRRPPAAPVATGPAAGSRSPRPVTVTLSTADPGGAIWVASTSTETDASGVEPVDPVTSGLRYTEPLIFDTQAGREATIAVRAAVVDAAGNRSRGDTALSFIVDKRPPGPVVVEGIPLSGATRDSVTLALAGDGTQIYYELTDDGSQPPPPRDQSPQYVSPFVVSGRDGEEVVYRVRARAVDAVGNVGPADLVSVFTVDRKSPEPPPAPSIAAIPTGTGEARYVLAWPELADLEIYHRVVSGEGGEYRRYRGPFEIEAGVGEGTVDVESYAVDLAGNRSETVRSSLSPVRRLAAPAVLGAEDGQIYRADRILIFDAPAGVIRYELTLDGTTPPAVTPDSQAATGPLELSVPEGATVDAAIRARAFPTQGAAVASAETSFRIRIDKTPPEPPVAIGIVDGGYYRDHVTASLLASEGVIYYSLGPADPQVSETDLYVDPVILSVPQGETGSFRLSAFTVDAAGNRSRGVGVWNVTLDDKVIYVAEEGSDRNSGTRDLPLRSLDQAVRMASGSARKVIHVALGTYSLARPLILDQAVTIVGGFTSAWQSSGLGRKATLTAEAGMPSGDPLVIATGSGIQISGLRFTHPAGEVATLVSVRGGEVRLEDTSVYLTRGEDRTGIEVIGGSLTLVGSELESDDGAAGVFLRARQGTLTVSSTTMRGPRSTTVFAAVALQDGSVGSFTAVQIDPGGGQRTDGVVVTDSRLLVARGTVESGSGGAQGAAIRATGSDVEITDTTIAGTSSGVYTFGVFADHTSLVVQRSRLTVAARAGATGIRSRGGSVHVSATEWRAADTREFSYLVDLAETTSVFHTNVLVGSRAGDAVVALIQGGSSDWFNNTIVAGAGTGLTAGFYLSGAGTNRLINNILVRREVDAGSALVLLGDAAPGLTLRSNNLSGWSYLVSADTGSARSGRLQAAAGRRITDTAELDALDGDARGGRIHGTIRESYLRTFRVSKQEDLHLSAASLAVNRGVDVGAIGGPTLDMDGETRPAPLVGTEPAYDIGADELY